jgi:hypothetical protein
MMLDVTLRPSDGVPNKEWARSLAERACRQQPNFPTSLRVAAASNAAVGRFTVARSFVERALQLDPDLRISTLKTRIGPLRPDRFARYSEALSKAGVPD